MYGAILGDMIGAPYEFDRGEKTKEFPLFCMDFRFTDDSAMTIAVAEALMDSGEENERVLRRTLTASMQKWGKRYPRAGYGGMFIRWLKAKHPKPYHSFGNGSAMRVSSAGWFYDNLEETRTAARLTAEVTHNHPEGIKGAESVASAIFMARNGHSKEKIRDYIVREFGYDLSRSCDEIRPYYHHVESCQETVPEAITAFLEGEDFGDVIRTVVSLGGDCDTLTCIAGSVAEAFYGVPDALKPECRNRLPEDMLAVLDRFEERISNQGEPFQDPFLKGNEKIEEAISRFHGNSTQENGIAVLESVRERMHADGHFLFPVLTDKEDDSKVSFQGIQADDGTLWHAAFTSYEEFAKGPSSRMISNFIDRTLKMSLEMEAAGFILNLWGESFMLSKEMIQSIFQADGDVEYTVPEEPLTKKLLADGTYLKRAVSIVLRNRTEMNMLRLMKILHESDVWVPCRAVFSDAD